jgi:succinate dehydrogenase / fumarate reductase cytochrome b subunit
MHLCTNSLVALSTGDADHYQQAVHRIHALEPFLVPVEIVFIFLPIAFHGLLGLKIWLESKPNIHHYPYWCNFRYTLQRITGVIVLAFILIHLWHMHWLGAYVPGDRGALFDPDAATTTAAYAMQSRAAWTIPVYAIGIASACYHFATGLWTFMITWGITVGERAQDRMGYVCAGVGVVIGLIGITAQVALMRWPNPTPRSESVAARPANIAAAAGDEPFGPAVWPADGTGGNR